MNQLLPEHGPTRDDVIAWAKNEVALETEKYKREKEAQTVLIPFRADRQITYDKQVFYRGGYFFLQSLYYQLQMDKICRKLKRKYKFKFDINAILSDLIYARILEPSSKRSSFKTASEFLESPSYELHDIYRALDILGNECDMIQSDIYKNSHFLGSRNDKKMTVRIITLRSSRKMAVKNMERAKNIVQIRSCRWDYLWMVTASRLLFPFSQETQTNRHL